MKSRYVWLAPCAVGAAVGLCAFAVATACGGVDEQYARDGAHDADASAQEGGLDGLAGGGPEPSESTAIEAGAEDSASEDGRIGDAGDVDEENTQHDSGDGEAAATGCVDVVLSTDLLHNPEEWFGPMVQLVRGGFWRNGLGLHAASVAGQKSTQITSPPFGDEGHSWLVVTTFDGASGKWVENRLYDTIPAQIGATWSTYHAGAGAPSTAFAADYRWYDTPSGSPTYALVGRLDQPSFHVSSPIADYPPVYIIGAIGWDGEAFAINANSGSDATCNGMTLHVARVDPAGKLLLPFTRYGCTPSDGWNGFKTSTDPTSGITYVFDAASAKWLSGHLRDGTPLPGTETKPKLISVPGLEDYGGAGLPAISATGDGAWIVWDQAWTGPKPARQWIARLDTAGNLTIPAVTITAKQPPDDHGGMTEYAVFPRPGGTAWIVAATAFRMYRFDHDGTSIASPKVIIDSMSEPMSTNDMYGFWWQDEAWLAYQEQRAGKMPMIRIIRIKDGCTYKPLDLPAWPLPDGG